LSFSRFRPGQNVGAELPAILLSIFPLDDLQDRLADGADHRVAAERVEVKFLSQHGRDLPAS
jgi:hypothetical protein